MKAKILHTGVLVLALNAVSSGLVQAAPPATKPSNNPNPTGPSQGFVDGGTAGQSMAPVNDSNMVPAYDMPPGYPDNPASGQSGAMGTPPGAGNNMPPPPPPPPPGDMPAGDSATDAMGAMSSGADPASSGSTSGATPGSNPGANSMTPPQPPPGMQGRGNGPGPGGMPPPAGTSMQQPPAQGDSSMPSMGPSTGAKSGNMTKGGNMKGRTAPATNTAH